MTIQNSIHSSWQRTRGRMHRDPARDWFALLVLSMIVLIGVIVWNAWLFDTVAGGGIIGTGEADAPPAFNRSSLDTVRTIFADRAAEETNYRTGAYRFADPSQ